MGEMTQDIRPEELLGIVQAALMQAADNAVRMGRISSNGRSAGANLKLPNGQTFRVQVEEVYE